MAEFDPTTWWAPFLAFAAGVVAFASPCVLPIVPGYLSFVTAAGDAPTSPHPPAGPARRSAFPILLFVAGFSVVFTSLGAFAGVLAPFARSAVGQRVAGLVVVAVGVFLLLYALRVGSTSLFGERRPFLARIRPGGVTAFPLGMAFAAGWTPCIGPVLAGTLALAATQSDPLRSAFLLFAFSMGLGVPFVLIGLGVGGLMRRLGVLQRHHRAISGLSGSLLVAIGLLLVTGAWVRITSPLLRLVNSFEPPI
ncbi:MAG: cytochrome c biogenesis CcdA family protein [Actinomycetota bacterium]|nr:sulfite exporter TauE/SafE family protein [Actinomycetota bacterium]